jgi:hypothetical protein
MNTIDRVMIYVLLGAALGSAIVAHIRISRLDDEMHRHLWLQAKMQMSFNKDFRASIDSLRAK